MALAVSRQGTGASDLREELDRVQTRHLEDEAADAAVLAALAARIDLAEKALARAADAPPGVARADAVAALPEDLRALRESVSRELAAVDAHLRLLHRRVDALGDSEPVIAYGAAAPLTPEEEGHWAAMSRDEDPGIRFSALSRLGQARTDRSVKVSLDALDDDDAQVVWQALRNLGRFGERDTAPRIAALLDHAQAVVRAAAKDALERMGAPRDAGYDPAAPETERRAGAEKLRRWAAERQG